MLSHLGMQRTGLPKPTQALFEDEELFHWVKQAHGSRDRRLTKDTDLKSTLAKEQILGTIMKSLEAYVGDEY